MFCPRCSAENKSEQNYCRQCGLPLAAAQLALTGQLDEILGELKKGEKSLQKGVTLLGIFLLVTLVTIPLSGVYRNTNGHVIIFIHWAISLIMGLALGLPGIFLGLTRLRRANRQLQAPDQASRPAIDRASQASGLLSTVPTTDPLISRLPIPSSVTEHETLDLKQPEPRP